MARDRPGKTFADGAVDAAVAALTALKNIVDALILHQPDSRRYIMELGKKRIAVALTMDHVWQTIALF